MLRPSIFYWFVVIFLLRMTTNMLQFLILLENTKATHAAFACLASYDFACLAN